jgi:hypothetical protein
MACDVQRCFGAHISLMIVQGKSERLTGRERPNLRLAFHWTCVNNCTRADVDTAPGAALGNSNSMFGRIGDAN